MVRFLPLGAFGLIGYAYGTTGVCRKRYLVGSVLASIPSAVGYAAIGAAVVSPGSARTGSLAPASIGLFATAVIIWRWRRSLAVPDDASPSPAGATVAHPTDPGHRSSDDDADQAARDHDDLLRVPCRPARRRPRPARPPVPRPRSRRRDLDPAADLAVDLHRVGDRTRPPAGPGRPPGSRRRPASSAWPSSLPQLLGQVRRERRHHQHQRLDHLAGRAGRRSGVRRVGQLDQLGDRRC